MKKITSLLKISAIFLSLIFSFATNAQTVQIGNDTTITNNCNPSPVNIWYKSTRMQIVYRKDELNAAGIFGGRISKLGFDIVEAPLLDLPNYTIKLKHDTVNDASSFIPGPFQTVYTDTLYAADTAGYDMFTLDTAFYWNGIDNLVVDVCWDRVLNYSCSGAVRYYTDTVIDNSGYDRSDGTDMCGQPIGSTSVKPVIQFVFQPLTADDAGIIGTNLGALVCSNSQTVKATVNNFGNNIIDSVWIGWTVNGVLQTPVKVTTNLDTANGLGNSFLEVTLGNYVFAAGTVNAVKIFSYLPNNTADSFNVNDTLKTTVAVGLNGTFTVGGASPDYATLAAAFADLDSIGICDTVILSIRNGTYLEQLILPKIKRGSASDYVIIESESGDSSTVVICITEAVLFVLPCY